MVIRYRDVKKLKKLIILDIFNYCIKFILKYCNLIKCNVVVSICASNLDLFKFTFFIENKFINFFLFLKYFKLLTQLIFLLLCCRKKRILYYLLIISNKGALHSRLLNYLFLNNVKVLFIRGVYSENLEIQNFVTIHLTSISFVYCFLMLFMYCLI